MVRLSKRKNSMPNMYITIKHETCFKRKELTPRLY